MSTIVVKFGGHAMTDEHGLFSAVIGSALKQGKKVVIVHGGGPQINKALEKTGIQSQFIGGFRVTSPEVFTIVEQVLVNEVGPSVAMALTDHGITAKAISGRSGVLYATRQRTLVDGSSADLGLVGTIDHASVDELMPIVAAGVVPVVSPIAREVGSNEGLNVNADIAAAAIAGAIKADELIIMTDVPGIYRNWPDRDSLIQAISAHELESLKGNFAEGMAPKVQACLDAINAGAQAVRIIDGTDPNAFLQALQGQGGTKVYQ